MDIYSVFGKAVAIIAVVVLLRIVWMIFRARMRGAFGETLLAGVLRRRLDASIYHVLNDIYLPLDDGSTTQIDHVVVSPFGVFVIETKTYKGWIFGNPRDAQWTQALPKRKSRFQNPLRQNYLHVQRLMGLTGLLADVVHSVVAFSGGGDALCRRGRLYPVIQVENDSAGRCRRDCRNHRPSGRRDSCSGSQGARGESPPPPCQLTH